MTDKTVHIVGLRAENVQRLELVELDLVPQGGVVEIHGRNGAGKTTLLNCLQMALAGAKAVGDVPIRTGAEDAEITVTTSNGLTITRRFTSSGNTYLDVRNAEGFKAGKAQTILDRLIGKRSLDPHAFMQTTAKKQAEQLRSIAGVDTRTVDAQITEAFDVRAAANRVLEREEARLADMPAPDPDLGDPDEEESTDELERELQSGFEHNAQQANLERAAKLAGQTAATAQELLEGARYDVESLAGRYEAERAALKQREKDERERLEATLADRQSRAEQAGHDLATAKAALAEFAPVDLDTLRERIAAINDRNSRRVGAGGYRRQEEAVGNAREDARRMTRQLEDLRQLRVRMISEATMPVPGLGFDGDKVTFNELPFDQAAHSEQLRVSLAIAMAAQPELRVINFTDASLLDKSSMDIVRELARDEGYQVLCEFVDSEPGESGIFIEAGRVTHIDGTEIVQPDEDDEPDVDRQARHEAGKLTADEAADQAELAERAGEEGLDIGSGEAGDIDPDEPLS